MQNLVTKLQLRYPNISFLEGDVFRWSPSEQTVTYINSGKASDPWSLLHELGHALLQHQAYQSDIELLQKEVAAWHTANSICEDFGVSIDSDHVETCLDSYRDWIHKRSTCPQCSLQGIQKTSEEYLCFNCKHTWVVTSARFCRPYRRSK